MKVESTGYGITLYNNYFTWTFNCEWLCFLRLRQWNWISITWLHAYTEYSAYTSMAEVSLGFLGFTVYFSIFIPTKNPKYQSFKKIIDEGMGEIKVVGSLVDDERDWWMEQILTERDCACYDLDEFDGGYDWDD